MDKEVKTSLMCDILTLIGILPYEKKGVLSTIERTRNINIFKQNNFEIKRDDL